MFGAVPAQAAVRTVTFLLSGRLWPDSLCFPAHTRVCAPLRCPNIMISTQASNFQLSL